MQTPNHLKVTQWQADRLATSHRDLLNHPRYHAATEYFLCDVYAAKDFSLRDQQIERVHAKLQTLLPRHMVAPLSDALTLNQLSQELDERLARMLFDEMGADHIDEANYCAAYRRCDNGELRARQIDLTEKLGQDLDGLIHKPLIKSLLMMSRLPAKLAGLEELQQSLERGFAAFQAMHGAQEFIDLIVARERQFMTRILSGDPHPFAAVGAAAPFDQAD
ncbi:hypothetical protein HNQ59_002275 [Chitinivorax tropicus]|uniref:DUF8198 domain-containing protein n=1 Tax=Chitinivorax tropicus TaxID=714531 RepID=A0A840MPM4_9PROT|nr:hypothetical protein [Chitinivorax tropicus]MBB5018977.1 hypothetical protein [Chitinivorax tropicus]